MRYAGEKKFNMWTVLTLILLAGFLIFVIYPIAMLLIRSLYTDGSLDLSYFGKFFGRKFYWSTLVNSFKVTIVSTTIATLIAVPMAYVLRGIKIKGSKLLNILIVMSYLSPPFIGAYAWIQLLVRNGLFTNIINRLFIKLSLYFSIEMIRSKILKVLNQVLYKQGFLHQYLLLLQI